MPFWLLALIIFLILYAIGMIGMGILVGKGYINWDALSTSLRSGDMEGLKPRYYLKEGKHDAKKPDSRR